MTALVIRVIVYFEQKRKSFLIIAPTSACAKVTYFGAVSLAPIIQCPDEIVKGFLRPEVNQCEYEILKSQSVTSSWGAKMAPIIPHP